MRGHLMKDGSRTAVTVQVHPDLRVQALRRAGARTRDRADGRPAAPRAPGPSGRVLLLTNLPTALPVDRLVTWDELMPSKLEQAIVAGQGVLPLSYAELARAHPDLWATAQGSSSVVGAKGCPLYQ